MKILNDNNKVDDVYLSPYDRWLRQSGTNNSTETLNNKKSPQKDTEEKS